MENPLVLGVDIGGSHITAGLINLGERKIISTSIKYKEINPHEKAEVIINAWCQVIEEAYAGWNVREKRIGLALPGPFDYENGICLIKEQNKFQSLYLMNIRDEFVRRLNVKLYNIKFVNDAEAFLRGELFAHPPGEQSVLGITLGTGLGSALCLKGEVSDADLWNTPFLDGIAEEYLGGGWLITRYHQLTGVRLPGVKELSARVNSDQKAKQVFGEFGHNLARFIDSQINMHRLDQVVIGGKISHAFDHFSKELTANLLHREEMVLIRVSELKENAALLGAATEEFDRKLNRQEL
ncbi:ROK family protein [Daejeonella lutea]|uniref:Glucokinase n=1 Tax=Daejeonella lutea TaxID=572036 RepID=A0A1T5BKC9_9SPHI|nr:ROK family protein [Daejeonella lutea]SKB47469.1 glucokinase [Daejeonella lutea]